MTPERHDAAATMPDQARLPTRPPKRNPETDAFWDGCAQGQFRLPRCNACGHHIWYPRLLCPECHSTDVAYVDTSGRGTLFSYTTITRGRGPYADRVPYLFAMIELDEGPLVLSNVVDVEPDEVEIGMPLEVVFEPVPESSDRLFRFRPAATSPPSPSAPPPSPEPPSP